MKAFCRLCMLVVAVVLCSVPVECGWRKLSLRTPNNQRSSKCSDHCYFPMCTSEKFLAYPKKGCCPKCKKRGVPYEVQEAVDYYEPIADIFPASDLFQGPGNGDGLGDGFVGDYVADQLGIGNGPGAALGDLAELSPIDIPGFSGNGPNIVSTVRAVNQVTDTLNAVADADEDETVIGAVLGDIVGSPPPPTLLESLLPDVLQPEDKPTGLLESTLGGLGEAPMVGDLVTAVGKVTPARSGSGAGGAGLPTLDGTALTDIANGDLSGFPRRNKDDDDASDLGVASEYGNDVSDVLNP